MGLGGSKLQDELDASKRDLTAARVKLQALEAQHGVLQTEAQQTAERLRQRDAELAAEGQERERLLRAKDDELGKAIKQRQLAEELRRNDALLAKRVMCAQMKAGGRSPVGADFDAGSVVAGGAMAAQMVLAADDMVQLRQVRALPPSSHRAPCISGRAPGPRAPLPSPPSLPHRTTARTQNVLQLGERLERADARGLSLQRSQTQQVRRELCDAVWAENLCDVSVALRGADFMALGALRLLLTLPLPLTLTPTLIPILILTPTLTLTLTLTHQAGCGCRARRRRASATATASAPASPCCATSETRRCRGRGSRRAARCSGIRARRSGRSPRCGWVPSRSLPRGSSSPSGSTRRSAPTLTLTTQPSPSPSPSP